MWLCNWQSPQGKRPAGTAPRAPLRPRFAVRRASGRVRLRHLRQYFVQVEGRGLLARRELGEAVDLLAHYGLAEVQQGRGIDDPIPIVIGMEICALERV